MTSPAHNTTPQNHAIPWSFSPSFFNGKEKDYESGFHLPRRGFEHHNAKYNAVKNYGARYYWSELLAGWLSVDPMMDKYPNISSYNYCVWNPVKLVDPDGNDVVYSSFKDRCYVSAARMLSKGFRMRYNDLKNSNEIYIFNYNDHGVNKLSTDGEKLYVNYSLDDAARNDGSTKISLLSHETEHAVQFEYGEVGFHKDKSGNWRSLNFDINDELKARDFEASGSIILNAKSVHGRWGTKGRGLETRDQKISFLRKCGYSAPDEVWNNRPEDIGKDETKFALPFRERLYQ